MKTREALLDVMCDIDPSYIKEHMDRAAQTPVQKIIRYAMPAAIYAAACIAVFILLPYLIGQDPEMPPSNIPVDTFVTETYPVSDTETDTTAESVTEEVTTEAETSAPPETETEEATVTSTTAPTSPIVPSVQETAAPHATTPPVNTTSQTTTTVTETEPDVVPEPKYMTHTTDSTVPYSSILYTGGYIDDDLSAPLNEDPVFTNAGDFRSFIDTIISKEPLDEYGLIAEFVADAPYFNESFFETHNLYINMDIKSSGSIYQFIDDVCVDASGSLWVKTDIYVPFVQTCDIKYILVIIAVDKDEVKTADVKYTYTTYREVMDLITGDSEYVSDQTVSEEIMTYTVNKVPEDKEYLRSTVIIRNADEMDEFLANVSKACGGDTETYFKELPQNDGEAAFEKQDYIYIGIYNSDDVEKMGDVKFTLYNGVLLIDVPPQWGKESSTGVLEMYVLRLSKNTLDEVTEIAVR